MAQSLQATPMLQANVGGTSTNVNLRDWMNARLAPFLKRALIDSLDAKAEFPLQWLGEQLILQSLEFEGNPDSTNIKERFLYKHEIKQKNGPKAQTEAEDSAQSTAGQQSQTIPVQSATTPSLLVQPEAQTIAAQTHTPPPVLPAAISEQPVQITTATNGTAPPTDAEQSQDTEMSNVS